MTLEEYLKAYRRGARALTKAEATIAGLAYPMPKGWYKRNRLLEVDGLAMRAAMLARRAAVAAKSCAPRKPTKKELKAIRRTTAAERAATRQERLSGILAVSVVVVDLAPAIDAATYEWVNGEGFLASFEWKQIRFKALQKYGRRCQCCGASPADGAVLNVDHVKSRRNRPDLALDLGNLQILCAECNHGKGNITADFR